MNWERMKNLRHSLLIRYLLIIMIAVLFLPIVFPITILIWYSLDKEVESFSGADLEKLWHKEAKKLEGIAVEEIPTHLKNFQHAYQDASVFWVNEEGELVFSFPERTDLQAKWDSSYTVEFMKRSYNGDPFTTVAFIGDKMDQGFIVFQIPREQLNNTEERLMDRYEYLYYISLIALVALFIFVSWWFFYRIRSRLVHLGQAMDQEGENGIPEIVQIKKMDEIGQLEASFNHMIQRLEKSREQQQEEENLRRELIANLSHDLRTPLTSLRGQLYSLKKEVLSVQGKESLALIDHKITYLGQLIDNLLSYTLLTTGKYPYNPKKLDLMRTIRTIVASWYPAFEKEGFQIEIEIPEKLDWLMDPSWFERVLDNLFQNIIRHAKEGQYIGIHAQVIGEGFKLIIQDHGPGFQKPSGNKGVGIGMAIVSLMLQEMNLKLEIDTGEEGTTIIIAGNGPVRG